MTKKDRDIQKLIEHYGSEEAAFLALSKAVDGLKEAITAMDRNPRHNRLISEYDQQRAKAAEDPAYREQLISGYVHAGGAREDIEHWLEHGTMP